MGWLFGQTWIWILTAFVLGLVLGLLSVLLLRTKKVEVTEERIAGPAVAASAVGELAVPALTVLEPTADQDDHAETGADQPPADATPTGRIPVLSADTEPDVHGADEAEQPDEGESESAAPATIDTDAHTATDTGAVGAGAFPNSAEPTADGSAPSAEYTVKGNADSMLFHTIDSPYYRRTRAEVWFRTPGDAEAAGFTAWNRKASRSTATAQALAKPVVEAGEYPGSARSTADGTAPSVDFTVKGNADSMLFHTIASPYYPRTRAEVWFRSEKDAEAAGFTAWNRRR